MGSIANTEEQGSGSLITDVISPLQNGIKNNQKVVSHQVNGTTINKQVESLDSNQLPDTIPHTPSGTIEVPPVLMSDEMHIQELAHVRNPKWEGDVPNLAFYQAPGSKEFFTLIYKTHGPSLELSVWLLGTELLRWLSQVQQLSDPAPNPSQSAPQSSYELAHLRRTWATSTRSSVQAAASTDCNPDWPEENEARLAMVKLVSAVLTDGMEPEEAAKKWYWMERRYMENAWRRYWERKCEVSY